MQRHLPILIAVALLVTAAGAGWAAGLPPGQISNTLTATFRVYRVTSDGGDPPPPSGDIVVPPVDPEAPPGEDEPPTIELSDIDGHWAAEQILALAALGVVTGDPDGTFRPDNCLTRAEATKLAVMALGLDDSDYIPVFSDAIAEWARPYIATGFRAGLIIGYPDGTFRPDGLITRAEWVMIVIRAWPQDEIGETSFADDLPDWAQEAIRKAAGANLVVGYPDGSFRPDRFVTRAEAAVIIYRACQQRL